MRNAPFIFGFVRIRKRRKEEKGLGDWGMKAKRAVKLGRGRKMN